MVVLDFDQNKISRNHTVILQDEHDMADVYYLLSFIIYFSSTICSSVYPTSLPACPPDLPSPLILTHAPVIHYDIKNRINLIMIYSTPPTFCFSQGFLFAAALFFTLPSCKTLLLGVAVLALCTNQNTQNPNNLKTTILGTERLLEEMFRNPY